MPRISSSGTWPGPVVLRSGWWKGRVRPVNDSQPGAALRADRGSVEFVRRCAEWSFGMGVPWVVSPPLPTTGQAMWRNAGFVVQRELMLFERPIRRRIDQATLTVTEQGVSSLAEVAAVDDRSFEPEWQIGRLGLQESFDATPRATILTTRLEDRLAGFVIVGIGLQTGFIQRIAVDPVFRGRQVGRSLLRSGLTWLRTAGARSVLLNTQLDNRAATSLYESEGFDRLPDRLGQLVKHADDE